MSAQRFFSPSVTSLFVGDDKFEKFIGRDFSGLHILSHLTHLTFEYNKKIRTLEGADFSKFNNLEYLSFEGTRITLKNANFTGLKNLKTLNLNRTNIKNIKNMKDINFTGLDNLEYLDLTETGIKAEDLREADFSCLYKLKCVVLTGEVDSCSEEVFGDKKLTLKIKKINYSLHNIHPHVNIISKFYFSNGWIGGYVEDPYCDEAIKYVHWGEVCLNDCTVSDPFKKDAYFSLFKDYFGVVGNDKKVKITKEFIILVENFEVFEKKYLKLYKNEFKKRTNLTRELFTEYFGKGTTYVEGICSDKHIKRFKEIFAEIALKKFDIY